MGRTPHKELCSKCNGLGMIDLKECTECRGTGNSRKDYAPRAFTHKNIQLKYDDNTNKLMLVNDSGIDEIFRPCDAKKLVKFIVYTIDYMEKRPM